MVIDKIFDALMFRMGSEEDEDGSKAPMITTGSIVWGVLLRTTISFILIGLLLDNLNLREHWYLVLFGIWAFAIYPAWRQWQIFQEKTKKFSEETLCGTCINFDETSQLCKIFDEHPTKIYIPCEGVQWEPKHYDSEN